MRKLAIALVIICAISTFAPYAQAGAVKKAAAGVINIIKTRGQTSIQTPTGGGAVRG